MQSSPSLIDVKPELALPRLTRALNGAGALLLTGAENSRPNPMTIGWASLGTAWGKPVLTVFVRPSRYTYELLEKARHFSVNVPADGAMTAALALCGAKSGRDVDKLGAAGLRTVPGRDKNTFIIDGCELYFECAVAASSQLSPESLDPKIAGEFYPRGDFHAVYQSVILHCYGRSEDEK